MTLSDDFNFSQNVNLKAPYYPVVFGVTFTPQLTGWTIGVLGLLGAVYMIVNIVMPEFTKLQELQTKLKDLQAQVEQKSLQAKQAHKLLEELTESKQQQSQVLALFANEKTLDTLLVDMSRLVNSSNTRVTSVNSIKPELKKFVLKGENPEIITDNSLGEKVNNKLKRQIIKVEIEGNFQQTQSFIRNIERLQPLLVVENYDSKLLPPKKEDTDDHYQGVRTGVGKISTSFDLVVLIPLTAQEEAKIGAKASGKGEQGTGSR